MSRYLTARYWLAWHCRIPFNVRPGHYATDGKRVWRLDVGSTPHPDAETCPCFPRLDKPKQYRLLEKVLLPKRNP